MELKIGECYLRQRGVNKILYKVIRIGKKMVSYKVMEIDGVARIDGFEDRTSIDNFKKYIIKEC